MTAVEPFYTNSANYSAQVRDPFHDTTECKYGREIKAEDRIEGHGNRARCDECAKV